MCVCVCSQATGGSLFGVHVLKEGVRVASGGEGREDKLRGTARSEAGPVVRVDAQLDKVDFFREG